MTIDIHCHAPLKVFLFNKHIGEKSEPRNLNFTTKTFVNIPQMESGDVRAAVAVHYLPERGLITNAKRRRVLRKLIRVAEKECGDFVNSKFEDLSSTVAPFHQITAMIKQFEEDVKKAHGSSTSGSRIAKSFTELKEALAKGETVFLNSVEGAHCLGHNIDYSICEDELTQLYELGVCQFTLAHFFENILVSSQGGIPPKIASRIAYDRGTSYPNGYNDADHLAPKVISKMLELGIIVDLVHCTAGAKSLIYELNRQRGNKQRPLVFSHTGLRELALKYSPDMPAEHLAYFPDAEDVLQIKECNGTMGVIFMDYWLNGKENNKSAIGLVVETMQAIKTICGNYDHISIGTDLDGFTEVPKDLAGEEHLPALIDEMRNKAIPDEDIEKICSKNYLRVLEKGWGRK